PAAPAAAAAAEPTAAAAESPATAAEPPAAEVRIDNFTFSPAVLTVAAGTRVTWVNGDDIPHTVVANDQSFRSRALDTDDRFAVTFERAGTYRYFCSLHPHMVATVVVQAAPDGAGRAP
ncbi:cupredoxin domain-containing protein, partial [Methylobacterium crusticola]